jgi:hypothetical protein
MGHMVFVGQDTLDDPKGLRDTKTASGQLGSMESPDSKESGLD